MVSDSHLLVIFSCQKYEDTRVKYQAKTWPRRLPEGMTYLVMTGDGENQIYGDGVLRLNVADGYGDLIDKTQALFDWFLQERSEPWLVKCDDDVWLSPQALDRIMSNQHCYAGAYAGDFAGGPLYILHRDTIASLGHLRDFVEDDNIAEDMAVGAAARAAAVEVTSLGFEHVEWYNHLKDGLHGSHTWDMAFAFTRGNHQALMEYCEKSYRKPEM